MLIRFCMVLSCRRDRRPEIVYLEDSQKLNKVNWHLASYLESIPIEDTGDWSRLYCDCETSQLVTGGRCEQRDCPCQLRCHVDNHYL